MTPDRDVLSDHSTPRLIMVEGVPWVSHEFHQRCGDELQDVITQLRAENERLRSENATMRWQMSAADVPCGCKQSCGDDGDIDGPGTCKDLPMKREPLVEVVMVPRSRRASDEEKAT